VHNSETEHRLYCLYSKTTYLFIFLIIMAEEAYEQTLLILRECFVYKIGPRPNAAGYKAQDWDPTKFIWSGRLVIVEKGEVCTIRLEDPNNGEVFASCPVDGTAVEPVLDSSRYFVLKIQDGSGRHAFVGMGFTERTDAFDFNASISDHLRGVQQMKESVKAAATLASQPKVDYSLKSGQTIHVELKGAKATSLPKKSEGSGGAFLPPPPKGRTSKPVTATSQPQQSQQKSDDFFSAFESGATPPAQGNPPPPQNSTDWFL